MTLIVVSSTAGAVVFTRSFNQRDPCKSERRGVFPVWKGWMVQRDEPAACTAAESAAIFRRSQEALLCQLFIYEVINLWTISSWEINSRRRVLRW